MSVKLMSEINNNYQMAVAVHRELADAFYFIGMEGYSLWNEYQYLDESCTQRKIKRYITSTYHVFMPDKLPKSANITEPFLSSLNRKQLKLEDTWNILKESFRIYQEWEESSLQLYQQLSSKLFDDGEISTFNFVSDEIIKDVKAELVFLTDTIISLNAMNWDIPTIVDQQTDYYERYKYLINNLLGESEQFHHWNSNLDAKSRVFFAKSPKS